MIPLLKKMTILVLASLQFVAPLVHAHAGMESAVPGLHVPGLESWTIGTQEPAVSSGNGDFRLYDHLVAVSSAIQQKPPLFAENGSDWSIAPPPESYSVSLDAHLIDFSPHNGRIVSASLRNAHATRAPPCPSAPAYRNI